MNTIPHHLRKMSQTQLVAATDKAEKAIQERIKNDPAFRAIVIHVENKRG